MNPARLDDFLRAFGVADTIGADHRLAALRLDRRNGFFGRSTGPTLPPTDTPTSLTTTLAPSDAIIMAMARPIPPPAPVTTATFPSRVLAAMKSIP